MQKYFLLCVLCFFVFSCSSPQKISKNHNNYFEIAQKVIEEEKLEFNNKDFIINKKTAFSSISLIEAQRISFHKKTEKPIKCTKSLNVKYQLTKISKSYNCQITFNNTSGFAYADTVKTSKPDQNKLKIKNYSKWSFIFGVLGVISFLTLIIFLKPLLALITLIFGIIAIRLGANSLKRIENKNETDENKIMAYAGLLIGFLIILIFIISAVIGLTTLLIIS